MFSFQWLQEEEHCLEKYLTVERRELTQYLIGKRKTIDFIKPSYVEREMILTC
jgi:hypothetical protein